MYTIGLDPSLRNWAIVVLEDGEAVVAHTICTDKKDYKGKAAEILFARFQDIAYNLSVFLDEWPVATIYCELPTGSQSASSRDSYAGVLAILAGLQVDVQWVSATEVKLAATGNKNATKDDMIAWAFDKHPNARWKLNKEGYPFKHQEHIADAFAVVEAGRIKYEHTNKS